MKSKSGSEYTIRWSPKALSNLGKIYRHVAFVKQEPQSAAELVSELYKFGEGLVNAPNSYPVAPGIGSGRIQYHKAVFKKNYLFIFRLNKAKREVLINNLHHAARHPDKRL